MCQAAGYIYKKLVNDGILNQAFSIAPVISVTEFDKYNSATKGITVFYFSYIPASKSYLERDEISLWDIDYE